MDAEQVERVREVVLKAHPDAVPELVRGETVEELLGSVEEARAAFARIAERVGQAVPVAQPPAVPAGAGTAAVDPAGLPAHELIRRGVAGRASRG